MDDYDNSAQDTSNYGSNAYDTNSYSQDTRQDSYESPQHHHESSHDHYSTTKEIDSPKTPESKSVDFLLPSSTDDHRDNADDTSDLIDIQKDSESHESTPQNENGNYENSIIDHFDSAFVGLRKDTDPTNETESVIRNENGHDRNAANQNNNFEKEDTDCCGCNSGPLMCLAIFCDCFCL